MPKLTGCSSTWSAVLLVQLLPVCTDAQQPPRMCAGNADASDDFTPALCAEQVVGTDVVADAANVVGADHRICCSCPGGWHVEESEGDRARCRPCPAGTEPVNRTACAACTGNTFSVAGQCILCVGDVTADHLQCVPCGVNEVADPPELGCRCENGFYNATDGPLLCVSRRQSLELIGAPENAHHCLKCPQDCVDCMYDGYTGRPLLQRGYGTSPSSPSWFDQPLRVVFECPGADKLACKAETKGEVATHALATNLSIYTPCEEGYEPPLCTVCATGFRIGGAGCSLCTGFSYMAIAFAAFLAFIFFTMTIESNSRLRHSKVVRALHLNGAGRKVRALLILLQEMFNDVKVFLSLYQVLSTMGQTLEISCESGVN
jgi:hypothetical protein